MELADKDKELAASSIEIEKLLQKIGENTAVAEKEKAKVAVIVSQVTTKAQASHSHRCSYGIKADIGLCGRGRRHGL